MPQSELRSGCGEQMDRAQMMAEWEPQQCADTAITGGLTTAVWALDVWRSSTWNCGRSDSHLTWQSRKSMVVSPQLSGRWTYGGLRRGTVGDRTHT